MFYYTKRTFISLNPRKEATYGVHHKNIMHLRRDQRRWLLWIMDSYSKCIRQHCMAPSNPAINQANISYSQPSVMYVVWNLQHSYDCKFPCWIFIRYNVISSFSTTDTVSWRLMLSYLQPINVHNSNTMQIPISVAHCLEKVDLQWEPEALFVSGVDWQLWALWYNQTISV